MNSQPYDLSKELESWLSEVRVRRRDIERMWQNYFGYFRKQATKRIISQDKDVNDDKLWKEVSEGIKFFLQSGRVDHFSGRQLRMIAARWSELKNTELIALLDSSDDLQKRWIKRFFRVYREDLIEKVNTFAINGVINESFLPEASFKNLGDLKLPLKVASSKELNMNSFITLADTPSWFRIREEFCQCLFGAKLYLLAKQGRDDDIEKVFDIIKGGDATHLDFVRAAVVNQEGPIKLSTKWYIAGLLAVFKFSTKNKVRALRKLGSVIRTKMGDPRNRSNKEQWFFISQFAADELKSYISYINRQDLSFFFQLPEVKMKDERSAFWEPFIAKAEWTLVIFDPSTLQHIKDSYKSESHQEIISRASVFGERSSHHVIVMGFPEVVVIEGHNTGAKVYLIERQFYELNLNKFFDSEVHSGDGLALPPSSDKVSSSARPNESSRNQTIKLRKFDSLRKILNDYADDQSMSRGVRDFSHITGWQRTVEAWLRNSYRLSKG